MTDASERWKNYVKLAELSKPAPDSEETRWKNYVNYPEPPTPGGDGMTYHDWLAGQALGRAERDPLLTNMERARACWDEADAMLAERKRRGEQRDKRLLD